MVQYFENKREIEYGALTLKPNDTLVVKINQDFFDIDEAQQLCEMIKQSFPKNSILCIFNGIELEVIHHE